MTARAAAIAEAPPRPRFDPIVTNRAARELRPPFRIVAFNARGGSRIDGILACLTRPPLDNAALILLCEADSGTDRSDGRDVAAELAGKLGMSCAYLPEFGFERGDGEIVAYLGNAILSAAPIRDARAIAMPSPRGLSWHPRLPRRFRRIGSPSGLAGTVSLGGTPVSIGVAHLHSRCAPAERARQMTAYLAEFPSAGPAIFGGDLNTTTTGLGDARSMAMTAARIVVNSRRFRRPQSYEPLFGLLRDAGLEVRGANADGRATFTFSKLIPPWFRPRLDWIALRELRPVEDSAVVVPARTSLLAPRFSDHDFIAVDAVV
jgi:endonuclease/exonuclease/phosphatase family metal-dependent hydrolase